MLAFANPFRFYAPWCGHCKNLKPAYEKAAKGLSGLAQVAAVNCDDEENKPFCGGMGVQGFPTLKIIKPSKKPGKPTVEDYQGPRTAKGIIDAVKLTIPNHVKRLSDKGLGAWLAASNETSKAILFSDKGTISALIKVLAAEYVDSINIAQVRDKEATIVEMFGVAEYPTLVVLPGGDRTPVRYEGELNKDSMKAFLSPYASPKASSPSKKQKPLAEAPDRGKAQDAANSEADSSSFSAASSSHSSADASEAAAEATTITLEDPSNPTESPDPIATPEEVPKPVAVPDLPPPIATLLALEEVQTNCLGVKTSTCILVLLPLVTDEEAPLSVAVATALASLAELAEKHLQRGSKLFPFYSIPASNPSAANLRDSLGLGASGEVELLAVNSRRSWWRHYKAKNFGINSVETWVDAIRLGEGQKEKLPEGLVAVEEPVGDEHDEL